LALACGTNDDEGRAGPGGAAGGGADSTGGTSASAGATATGGSTTTTAGAATGGNNGNAVGSGTGGASGSAGGPFGSGGRAGSGNAGAATGGNGGAGGTAASSAGSGGLAGSGGGSSTEPAEKTVRVFWLRPSDVPFDQKLPDGIGKVMLEAQSYYKKELGKTFKLNTQIVETVVGERPKSWYENTPNGGDNYWYSVFNMRDELVRRFQLKQPDSRWMIVGEISAEGPGAGGGGTVGWVMLPEHDANGAAGIGATFNRWCGGMVHELGHAFGLPDAASTDGTPMSASLYEYPNTHFSQSQKSSILNGPSASFLF
jgi:hypothetical protein